MVLVYMNKEFVNHIGDDQRNGLDQFKALEYDTWAKVLNRVNGVNFREYLL